LFVSFGLQKKQIFFLIQFEKVAQKKKKKKKLADLNLPIDGSTFQ
jgi:hypothetical protein